MTTVRMCSKRLFCLLILSGAITNSAIAQPEFKRIKVFFRDGMTVTGSKGSFDSDRLTMIQGKVRRTYEMSDIQMIMAKEDRAGTYAGYAMGGCAAMSIAAYVASDDKDEIDTGQYLVGTVIWMAIFGGAGCLIGSISDHWEVVYNAPARTSEASRHKLAMARMPWDHNLSIGLSYRF